MRLTSQRSEAYADIFNTRFLGLGKIYLTYTAGQKTMNHVGVKTVWKDFG